MYNLVLTISYLLLSYSQAPIGEVSMGAKLLDSRFCIHDRRKNKVVQYKSR